MTLHEKWENIDHRLRMLETVDQEEEAGLLGEAYERLISAYQEARRIKRRNGRHCERYFSKLT